jgi:outer membrane biosynthesis protein TonB
MKSHEEQELRSRVEQVRGRLESLTADLRVVDGEVESLAPQREHHELLDRACGSLEKLAELGVASLFWGDGIGPVQIVEQLRGVRSRVSTFQAQLDELDERRRAILAKIDCEEKNLEILGEDLYQVRETEERRKLEWIVERDISPLPPRVQRMAWARGGEDDTRFHKSLAGSLLASLLLGALLPMIDLPLPKRFVPEEMPKRLAQLVRPELAKPLPKAPAIPEPPPEQKPPEQPEPVEEPKPSEQLPEAPAVAEAGPTPSESPGPGPEGPGVGPGEPRKQVAKAGILAFRDQFASLAKDDVAPRLGADARYGDADDVSKGLLPTRSMLTTNAPGSSGGINLGSLSRNVGGGQGGPGGGGGIQGVPLGRATSAIASIGGGGGGDRPRARGGQAASRTDEEIQIVFDRYKASFYRLYNRELRNDPTLQGQMVLRLTIEPDGSVSMCKLQSTDMDAPDLASQVVNRVRKINFGPKDGVAALTIVYPIDFLPKA